MDHLKLIEDKLAFHRAEIDKLETAKKVLLELSSGPADHKATRPKASAGKKPKKAAAASVKPAPSLVIPVRRQIEEALKSADEPMTSGKLIAKLGFSDRKQPVYTALNSMHQAGQVTKDAKGGYALAASA